MNSAPDAARPISGPRGLLQAICGSFCLANVLLACSSAWAGEKIQITESPEKINLPKETKDSIPLEPRFMPPRLGSPDSGKNTVMPQPNQPLMMRNPRFEETFDRRKNWAFDSPNSFDRDRAIEETFGVRNYDLDDIEQRPKGAVERYFDADQEAKPGGKSGRSGKELGRETLNPRNEFDPSTAWREREESETGDSGGIIQALNPAQLFNWTTGPESGAQLGGLFGGNSALPGAIIADAPFGQTTADQPVSTASPGLREYERTWDFRKSSLGTPFGDPINEPDATRAIMNPIAARKTSVPPPASSQSRFGESFGNGSAAPISMRPDFMSPGQDRISTPSFKPLPSAPVRSPILQPKPGILEIPRPKF